MKLNKLLSFTFPGVLIPYKRMTQRSKWLKRNQEYGAQQMAIQIIARNALALQRNGEQINEPIGIILHFEVKSRRGSDSDNLAKAVGDGMSGAVYKNDSKVDGIIALRTTGHTEDITRIDIITMDEFQKIWRMIKDGN